MHATTQLASGVGVAGGDAARTRIRMVARGPGPACRCLLIRAMRADDANRVRLSFACIAVASALVRIITDADRIGENVPAAVREAAPELMAWSIRLRW